MAESARSCQRTRVVTDDHPHSMDRLGYSELSGPGSTDTVLIFRCEEGPRSRVAYPPSGPGSGEAAGWIGTHLWPEGLPPAQHRARARGPVGHAWTDGAASEGQPASRCEGDTDCCHDNSQIAHWYSPRWTSIDRSAQPADSAVDPYRLRLDQAIGIFSNTSSRWLRATFEAARKCAGRADSDRRASSHTTWGPRACVSPSDSAAHRPIPRRSAPSAASTAAWRPAG